MSCMQGFSSKIGSILIENWNLFTKEEFYGTLGRVFLCRLNKLEKLRFSECFGTSMSKNKTKFWSKLVGLHAWGYLQWRRNWVHFHNIFVRFDKYLSSEDSGDSILVFLTNEIQCSLMVEIISYKRSSAEAADKSLIITWATSIMKAGYNSMQVRGLGWKPSWKLVWRLILARQR